MSLHIIVIAAVLLGAGAAGAGPQFASGVNLVEVYATVTDDKGGIVQGLTPADFRVEEDGRSESITAFAAGAFPLTVAVAIDRSFSISPERLRTVADAVRGWMRELRSEDEVMLLAIGSEVEVLAPRSTDRRPAIDALAALRPWGTTPLHDGVLSALSSIAGGRGRRALVLLSDGRDRFSAASRADVLEGARRADVLVYPIALAPVPPPLFTELARITAGRAFQADSLNRLPSTLSSIAIELRFQYLLGYVPSRPASDRPGWRSIRVSANRPDLRVRAREGYVAR